MLNISKKIFHSFKERPDIWFFYAFLATSTLSIRKVLFYYPINNTFNEYTGVYLYLSDIFLFLTLAVWLLTLCNKKHILSIYISISSFVKNVPRGTFRLSKMVYQQVMHNYVLILPLFIALFSFLSILWSNNQQIATFRSFKLSEFILLFFYTYKLFHVEQFEQNKIISKRALQIIIGASIIQSIVGIIQFFIQQSIGLLWLKESILSRHAPGIAKIILNGQIYIREYGLFPHPNIFGGFLVFSILISILYFKMFHVEHFVKIKQCTRTCLRSISHIINVPRGTFMILFIISIQGLSLLLTFSKSAIIGLFIGFLYLYIKKCSIPVQMFHVEHSTGQAWNNSNILKTSHIYKKLLLIVAIMAMLFVILKPDTYSLIFKSLQERTFYLNVSRGTFLLHPLIGIGAGQFIINMRDIIDIQSWQYQPVHNVFLLILNEFGIVVLFMFLYFIYKMFNSNTNVPPQYKCSTWNILRGTRGTLHAASAKHYAKQSASIYFKAILVSFIFIMLFDHYFWDIQQGQILLWLLFGIIVGNNRK